MLAELLNLFQSGDGKTARQNARPSQPSGRVAGRRYVQSKNKSADVVRAAEKAAKDRTSFKTVPQVMTRQLFRETGTPEFQAMDRFSRWKTIQHLVG